MNQFDNDNLEGNNYQNSEEYQNSEDSQNASESEAKERAQRYSLDGYSLEGFPSPRNPASADKKKITQLEWLMPDYETQKKQKKEPGTAREIGDLAKELEATALDGEEIPELKISTAITEGAIWPSTAPEPVSDKLNDTLIDGEVYEEITYPEESIEEYREEYRENYRENLRENYRENLSENYAERTLERTLEEPAGVSFRDHNAGNLGSDGQPGFIPELPRSLGTENTEESESTQEGSNLTHSSTRYGESGETKPQNKSIYSKEALANIPTPQLKTLEMKAPNYKASRMPRGFLPPDEADLPKGSGPDLPPSRKGKLPTEIEQIFQGRMGKVVAIVGASVIVGFLIGTCFLATVQKPAAIKTSAVTTNAHGTTSGASKITSPVSGALNVLNLGPKTYKTWEEAQSAGETYIKETKYKEGQEAFSAALKISPDKYESYAQRGLSLYLLNDYKSALTDLNQALSANSRYLPALYDRAATYFALADYSRALIDYDLILAIEPGNTQALLGQALCRSQQGQSEACLKALRHITQGNPQESLAHRLAGEEFLKQEDYERAVSAFSKAIEAQQSQKDQKTDKDKDVLLALRARAYILHGNKQAAIQDLEEALKLNPNNSNYKHDKEVAERELP